jgi:hypothetical protein
MMFRRPSKQRRLLALLVISSYVLLTFVFWGTFVADRGLPGETGFVELSQARPGIEGFVYPYDSARRLMSLSFHSAYLLSNGSYLSLHLLFGAWILATGLLTYLIVRSLVPQSVVIAYLAGAVSITFGADQGLNWAAYVVQRQTVVFGLLAIWLLLWAWEHKRPWLFLLVAICQFVSLWTYEACLPALLITPLLLFRPPLHKRRLIFYSAAWSAIPGAKLLLLVYANWVLRGATYEARVLATRPAVITLVENLVTLAARGLAFWNWPKYAYAAAAGCEAAALGRIIAPLLAGIAIFLLAALLIRRLDRLDPGSAKVGFGRLIPSGLVFFALAYALFTFLPAPTPLRTQFVSAVPGAIVIAALCCWLDSLVGARGILSVGLTSLVVGCGLSAGLLQQLGLAHDWSGYRKIMGAIVDAVPCLKDDTMVVLVDMPQRISYSLCANDAPFDPFRDVMWFNSGLQVMYPGTKLVGIYYREDGSGSDSIRFRFASDGATLDQAGVGLEGNQFGYARMVAFRYDRDQGAVLLDTFPAASIPGAAAAASYEPRTRIACTVPPETVRHRLDLSRSSK